MVLQHGNRYFLFCRFVLTIDWFFFSSHLPLFSMWPYERCKVRSDNLIVSVTDCLWTSFLFTFKHIMFVDRTFLWGHILYSHVQLCTECFYFCSFKFMHLERVYQRVKRKQLIKIFKLFWQNRKQKTYVEKKSLEGFSVSVDLCKKKIYIYRFQKWKHL